MLKKFLLAIGAFILVVAVLGAVKASQIKAMSSMSHEVPPTAVTTMPAKAVVWRPVIRAIGTLAPVEGVTLAADAEGTIVKIAVESGAPVKAGDLIVALDTSVEEAQLRAAEAQAELAKLQYDRATDLVTKNTISQAELDQASAQRDQARANVGAIKATIARKNVRAPFDGRVGIRQVNLGQFVARGAPLVPLQKLDPIFVNFSVPQQQLPSLALNQKILIRVEGVATPFDGAISAINSVVDASTRNVAVQALLSNPKEQLRAGMFVQVEVELPAGNPRIVLPATAISYASYGDSVFIVEKMKEPGPDGKEYLGVRQQPVKLGDTRGDLIAVEGVKEGEEVVTSGVFKLRPAAPVQINNTGQPSASATPKPSNS